MAPPRKYKDIAHLPAEEYAAEANRRNVAERKTRDREGYNAMQRESSAKLRRTPRRRAKRKGLRCTITREWVEARLTRCAATGVEFDFSPTAGPWVPSIDRIDSDKGYTPDNCRVVVWSYNMAKSNWSDDDVKRLALAVLHPETE